MKKKALALLLTLNCLLAVGQSKVGINTASPLELLDVNGNINLRGLIKLNSSAGTSGQVLTSKGPSLDPIWANTAYSGNGRFWLTMSNNTRTGTQTPTGRGSNWVLNDQDLTTQEDSLDFASVFVQGTDFTITNSGSLNNYITVNKTGLYHFEGVVRIFVTGDVDGPVMTPRGTLRVSIFKQGVVNSAIYQEEALMQLTAQPSTGFANKSYNLTVKFGIDINLESGTTLTLLAGFNQLRMTAGFPLISMGITQGGYISGQFIAE